MLHLLIIALTHPYSVILINVFSIPYESVLYHCAMVSILLFATGMREDHVKQKGKILKILAKFNIVKDTREDIN